MKYNNSLRIFLPITIFVIGLAIVGIYTFIDAKLKYNYLKQDLYEKYKTMGNRISHTIENRELLHRSNTTELMRLFAQYSTEYLDIAKIYDANNNLMFKTVQTTYALNLRDKADKELFEKIRLNKKPYIKIDIKNKKVYAVFYIMMPLRKNQLKAKEIGIMYLEFDISQNIKHMTDAIYKSLIVNGFIIFLIMLILYTILNRKIFKRINKLVGVTEKLKNGDFDIEIEDKGSDEISVVISSYKEMALKLKQHFAKLKESEANAYKASRAKSKFLANMSHEIRTPLNAILGFIDLLKEENIGKAGLEYIHTIDLASRNLMQIINDILDFSKIESGKITIEKMPFDPVKELQNSIRFFQEKASEKKIKLIFIKGKNIPAAVVSDPLRLKQIVNNLLSNAIKFTPENKTITLYITYRKSILYISVKDEGIGIAKDKQEHIFDAFSQEDSSTTRKYGGTGLGLTISYKLTKLLGGKLYVTSEQGKGSIFILSIPTKKAKVVITENKKLPPLNLEDKKILLVEDNKANQMFMHVILKKLNLKFDIASDGFKALELFKKNSYDAILMDENMPNMSGIEATQKILQIEREKNLQHTPIIALTANALKGDKEKFLDAGMDEYLTKPLDKEQLVFILIKLFDYESVKLEPVK